MKFFFLLALFSVCLTCGYSQQSLQCIVADSATKKVLPFATIRISKTKAALTGIDGHFNLSLHSSLSHITISYVGYFSKDIPGGSLKNNDTIFLSHSPNTLQEVTVVPQNEKIRRIINTAIKNKPLHNPELYERYQCFIYYKMHADLLLSAIPKFDSLNPPVRSSLPAIKNNQKNISANDSNRILDFIANNHIIFSETYSRRNYKKPNQLQEDIIASKFSGLKKTYFTSLVTDVMPFHVYSNYISLNGTDYINPVSKGWQQRYRFNLADEVYDGNDTIYILSFRPKKNTSFNALKGVVYINSDGYAISNFISSTGDSSDDREIRIEQKYSKVGDKWFPEELNYDVILKKYPSPKAGIKLNGHSIISNVSFNENETRFHKAHPVMLTDSVDLHTNQDWQSFRPDSITSKEKNTYKVLDSLSEQVKLDNKVSSIGKITIGKLGIGPLDLDINRVLVYNQYEGTRLGLGFTTNEKISKYYSLGVWAGYGFSDKRWKYGGAATIYPAGEKDNWLQFSYQDNYQSAGDIRIHPDIDNEGFRNWLLEEVDRIKQFHFTGHTQRGYWEIELNGMQENLQSLYDSAFQFGGKSFNSYNITEAGIGIKYAYGEKRIPVFGYYVPYSTSYPILYFRIDGGNIQSENYSTNYFRSLIAVSYTKHFNRWGNDKFQFEAGMIHSFDDRSLSRSFLLAGKGFRNDYFNYYAWGGFITMRPYDYFSDRYISFFYRHDFDKFLWQLKYSKPFISIQHNLIYGGLTSESKLSNPGIEAPVNGFHESGILLNQLIALNYVHLANIYINAGLFYHWSKSVIWNQNLLWAAGVSIGF